MKEKKYQNYMKLRDRMMYCTDFRGNCAEFMPSGFVLIYIAYFGICNWYPTVRKRRLNLCEHTVTCFVMLNSSKEEPKIQCRV